MATATLSRTPTETTAVKEHKVNRKRKPVQGVEQQTTDGLRGIRPLWEHEVDHARTVMSSLDAAGYQFAIAHITGRVFRLYTNIDLSYRLFMRLYNRPRGRQPLPQTSIRPSCPIPEDGGAISETILTPTEPVAPTLPDSNRSAIAALAGQMGAKRIQKHLLSQGRDVPMTTVKRYMREARNANHVGDERSYQVRALDERG